MIAAFVYLMMWTVVDAAYAQGDLIQIDTGDDPRHAVVWLHGLGADGNDFVPIVGELGLPADLAVRFQFPHAPMRPITINGGMVMRGWYDIRGMEIVRAEDGEGIEHSAAIVAALLDGLQRSGIPPEHIVLAGFSQGGAIALHVGLRYGKTLAGIMALSTYVPMAARLPEEIADANRNTPLFMAHGSFDPIVPQALGDASQRQLKELGVPVEWHTYPMQHNVSREEIDDIGAWLTRVLK